MIHSLGIRHFLARRSPKKLGVLIAYKPGLDISIEFSTEPDVAMYEFPKESLDFRIAQMKKQTNAE